MFNYNLKWLMIIIETKFKLTNNNSWTILLNGNTIKYVYKIVGVMNSVTLNDVIFGVLSEMKLHQI